jgi:hypothetical protein
MNRSDSPPTRARRRSIVHREWPRAWTRGGLWLGWRAATRVEASTSTPLRGRSVAGPWQVHRRSAAGSWQAKRAGTEHTPVHRQLGALWDGLMATTLLAAQPRWLVWHVLLAARRTVCRAPEMSRVLPREAPTTRAARSRRSYEIRPTCRSFASIPTVMPS